MNTWRGVFFDLDGTLADTVELILRSFRHTMQTHLGEVVPDERWIATLGTPLVAQLREFARDEEEAAAMLTTYTVFQRGVHDDMVRPFPGARAVLDELAERGSSIAVVTSKRGVVARRTLDVCGLTDVVDLLISADDVARAKPDPLPVLRALEILDLGRCADQVVFVGDAPFDLMAGRAAGTRTAAVSWGPFAPTVLHAQRPDFFLESLPAVLELSPGV